MPWTDNPTPDGYRVISSLSLGGGKIMDIEEGNDGSYRLVVGNLFFSEAMMCRDAKALIKAIGLTGRRQALSEKERKSIPVVWPDGVTLAG